MHFETIEYKGNTFTIWEAEESFLVVVDNESYELNTVSDVKEFIQYYRNN